MPVTERKDKARALFKAIDRQRMRVKVGIFGEAAAEKAIDGKGATVGQIANAHEHGIGVPQRSWLEDTITADAKAIDDGLRVAAAHVIKAIKSGADPVQAEAQALAQIGAALSGRMKERIASGIAPALSPGYLARKLRKYPGATTPLIASGQMWGAIGFTVENSPNQIKSKREAARRAVAQRKRERLRARKAKARARTIKNLKKSAAKLSRNTKRSVKRTTRTAAKFQRRSVREAKRQLRSAKRAIKRATKRRRRR